MFLIRRKNYVFIGLQCKSKISIWSSLEEKEEDERKEKKTEQAEDPGTKQLASQPASQLIRERRKGDTNDESLVRNEQERKRNEREKKEQ